MSIIQNVTSTSTSYQGQGSSSSSATRSVSGVETAGQSTVDTSTAASAAQDSTSTTGNSSNGFTIDENTGREQGQASNEQIRQAVEKINKNAQNHGEAIFGIHEATHRVTIKIVDKDTKEVIKEYPPEKTLDMIAKVWEMAGILVDEKR